MGGIQSEWWWCMDESLSLIVNRLATHRHVIIDNLLQEEEASALLSEVKIAHEKDLISVDGIIGGGNNGNTSDSSVDKAIRGDKVGYFYGTEPDWPGPVLHGVLQKLNTLVVELGVAAEKGNLDDVKRELRGIKTRSRAMITCYPPGGRYTRHVDNPCGNGRIITSILYLNPDWKTEDGANLHIHPPVMPPNPTYWQSSFDDVIETVDINPIFNRLVLFYSDHRCPHEVSLSFKERFALTVWFIDSDKGHKFSVESGSQRSDQRQADAVESTNDTNIRDENDDDYQSVDLFVVKQEMSDENENICNLYIKFLGPGVNMQNLILDVGDEKCLISVIDVSGYETGNVIEVALPFKVERGHTSATFKKKKNLLTITVVKSSENA